MASAQEFVEHFAARRQVGQTQDGQSHEPVIVERRASTVLKMLDTPMMVFGSFFTWLCLFCLVNEIHVCLSSHIALVEPGSLWPGPDCCKPSFFLVVISPWSQLLESATQPFPGTTVVVSSAFAFGKDVQF